MVTATNALDTTIHFTISPIGFECLENKPVWKDLLIENNKLFTCFNPFLYGLDKGTLELPLLCQLI